MILINGRIITQDIERPYIENGSIVIKGERIVDLGNTEDMIKKYPEEEIEDVNGKVIMPGLINTHHHIYSAFARGMKSNAPSKDFIEILENLWWKLDKKLNLEDVEYSALTTYIDCIKNGVTTVIDHHASPMAITGSLERIAKVADYLGIRTSLCYEVSDRDGIEKAEEGIRENVEFIKYADRKNSDMIKGMFGIHASFTVSNETLEKCKKAMENIDVGYHIHVAEGITDLNDAQEKYGKRVVERLNEYGIFKENTIAVHCIHINDYELDILKNSGCNVIHNPESNMGNAVGCSPAIKMLEEGLIVGLGTDGYTADMIESLKVANILHKHELKDPTVGWKEAPLMLFRNNREIIKKQFGCNTGILKKGAKADIAIFDYIPHTELNENNYNSHIIFGISGRGATTTICNGKILMKKRKLINVDEKSILEKARTISKQMWKSVEK